MLLLYIDSSVVRAVDRFSFVAFCVKSVCWIGLWGLELAFVGGRELAGGAVVTLDGVVGVGVLGSLVHEDNGEERHNDTASQCGWMHKEGIIRTLILPLLLFWAAIAAAAPLDDDDFFLFTMVNWL